MTWPLQGQSRIITGDETLTVNRYEDKVPKDIVYVEGKAVKRQGRKETFTITCNVQPLNGRDLLLVPEGDRFKEQYWIFMNNQQRPIHDNDEVVRIQEGKTVNYQVQSSEQWGSYSRARIMRIDVGPDATP